MQFIYHKNAGEKTLVLDGDKFRHVFGSRRSKKEQLFYFRNLKDSTLYSYNIIDIGRKSATLSLNSYKISNSKKNTLHIFWCLIDIRSIQKALPFLNEMKVDRITFIQCERSQQNIKIDFDKLQRILIESSEQCGRVDTIKLDTSTFEKVIKDYPDIAVIDFGGETKMVDIQKVLIGCEGGFSENERALLKNHKTLSFDTDTILRSQSAAIAIASKAI